jgi:LCP family protein required for cell wall assembly
MNDFRKDPSSKRFARQAIDGFISTPSQNRLGTPNNLRPIKKPVFNDRLRSNLRVDVNSPAALPKPQSKALPARPLRPQAKAPQKPTESEPKPRSKKQFADQFKQNKESRKLRRNRVKKTRPKWRSWAIRGTIATFVVAFALTGLLVAKGYLKLNQILEGGGAAAAMEANVDPTKLKGEGDGRINILLLGRGGEGHDGPDLTDTILVASIDPINKKSALISVPRDMWVQSKTGSSKINAVFAGAKNKAFSKNASKESAEKAGIDAVEGTIEDVLGINMHYYAVIDFKGFEKAVKTVGGVTINVPEELRDPTMAWENNRNPVLAKQGVQKMDGKQALMYVRSRHGSARGDFDRSERQRLFIMALKDAVMSSGTYSNPVKISKLMDDFGDHAKTDFGMSDLLRLHSITKGIDTNKMESIGLADPPHDYLITSNYAGQSIVQPKEGIFKYNDIRKYIRSKLPDGYIVKEKAPIMILNGTATEGRATEIADDLKTYSYNIKKVDNAPTQNYEKTIIVDLTGKNKYTKNYLEKRFNTKVARKLPEGITIPEQERKGFVIIIGRNETDNR